MRSAAVEPLSSSKGVVSAQTSSFPEAPGASAPTIDTVTLTFSSDVDGAGETSADAAGAADSESDDESSEACVVATVSDGVTASSDVVSASAVLDASSVVSGLVETCSTVVCSVVSVTADVETSSASPAVGTSPSTSAIVTTPAAMRWYRRTFVLVDAIWRPPPPPKPADRCSASEMGGRVRERLAACYRQRRISRHGALLTRPRRRNLMEGRQVS